MALKMEAASTTETTVDNYFTRKYIPEDKSELHTRSRENLKSHKLKDSLTLPLRLILKSYLTDRLFQVKYNQTTSDLYPIQSGVPQGSVLAPVLYTIYTADLPTNIGTEKASFADDTAIMASDQNPVSASQKLQAHLSEIEHWLLKWRMKANATKSIRYIHHEKEDMPTRNTEQH
jgi:hypothetical protein